MQQGRNQFGRETKWESGGARRIYLILPLKALYMVLAIYLPNTWRYTYKTDYSPLALYGHGLFIGSRNLLTFTINVGVAYLMGVGYLRGVAYYTHG